MRFARASPRAPPKSLPDVMLIDMSASSASMLCPMKYPSAAPAAALLTTLLSSMPRFGIGCSRYDDQPRARRALAHRLSRIADRVRSCGPCHRAAPCDPAKNASA